MFNNKMKAVTFSYDDGIFQDQRLIALFNKYGLKCTFNINSGLCGVPNCLVREDRFVPHVHFPQNELRDIYSGHEIAAHTVTHPSLLGLPDEEVIKQVEEDRLVLSDLAGYEVVGMAYPGGTGCFDDHTIELIRNNTGIKYSRTTTSTHSFDLQTNLLEFNPTVYHHVEWNKMIELAEQFISLKPDTPKLFYIWGHAFEFDIHEEYWDKFEEFLKLISGKDDIFYGTNKQCLLGMD